MKSGTLALESTLALRNQSSFETPPCTLSTRTNARTMAAPANDILRPVLANTEKTERRPSTARPPTSRITEKLYRALRSG